MTFPESGSKRLERLLAQIESRRNAEAAFSELYHATKGKLFATVLLIVKRRDLAEEVTQDVYMRIWSKAGTYRSSSGAPMTWRCTGTDSNAPGPGSLVAMSKRAR